MTATKMLVLTAMVGIVSSVLPAEDASAKEKKCPVKRTVDCGGDYGTPPSTVQPDPRRWFTPEIQEIVGYRHTGIRGRLSNIVTYPDQSGGCAISGERLRKERPGFGCQTIENTDNHKRWRVVIQGVGGTAGKMSRPVRLYAIQEGSYQLVREFHYDKATSGSKSPRSNAPAGGAENKDTDALGDIFRKGAGGILKGIPIPKLP